LNVFTILLAPASMREMVSSSVLSAQTAPSPTAMLLGADRAAVNEPTRA
jgi:hypothetical protein